MRPAGDGLVVCPQPLAAAVGGRTFEQGGNAIDAAIAVALAQGVVDPVMCGIGGIARVFTYTRQTGRVALYGGWPHAGRLATPDCYEYEAPWELYPNRHAVKGNANFVGHTAAIVPTELRVLHDVHAQLGILPWAALVEPAIELAHDGFAVYPYLYRHWDAAAEAATEAERPPPRARIASNDESAGIYLRPDGNVFEVGERLRQKDYGQTLELVAAKGADAMYHGQMAKAIADDFARHGGFVTLDDLESTRTIPLKTYSQTYWGDAVAVTDGPPAAGLTYLQALNVVEALDLQANADSISYWNKLAHVFQAVHAYRAAHNGDPDWVSVPIGEFLSKNHARSIAATIDDKHDAPEGEGGSTAKPRQESTSSVSTLDRWGNAVVVTHSNGSSAGVVTPGLGFLYNNHMHNFDPRPGQRNSIAVGKLREHGTPLVMWFREDHLVGLDGSLSRFAVTADLQVTLSLRAGAELQSAIEAPRLHAEYLPGQLYVEPQFPEDIVAALCDRGWKAARLPMTAPLGMIRADEHGMACPALDPRGGQGLWPDM